MTALFIVPVTVTVEYGVGNPDVTRHQTRTLQYEVLVPSESSRDATAWPDKPHLQAIAADVVEGATRALHPHTRVTLSPGTPNRAPSGSGHAFLTSSSIV